MWSSFGQFYDDSRQTKRGDAMSTHATASKQNKVNTHKYKQAEVERKFNSKQSHIPRHGGIAECAQMPQAQENQENNRNEESHQTLSMSGTPYFASSWRSRLLVKEKKK